ncbi:MAG TPA: L-threonylcarbamoyladenylate synthase [Candidatus Aquicultoraceae bacterium]|nr:L-threonylcarbamoyladenylate synthase [Candidatus Aquicultoraceae bacterium]
MARLVRLAAGSASGLPPGLAASIRDGGVVVYPTDTVYGLGVDPFSRDALRRLLSLKGRQEEKPVPLLLDGAGRAYSLASRVPLRAKRLMERFWPGALTLVLPASPAVPGGVAGGDGTVGLRVPDHPVPRELAAVIGGAITGTSANRAGGSCAWRTAEELAAEFEGEADWVLWDGPRPGPRGPDSPLPSAGSSTVVRVTEEGIQLVREGAIPFRTIADFLGRE